MEATAVLQALMDLDLLPDGEGTNRPGPGWVESLLMLLACRRLALCPSLRTWFCAVFSTGTKSLQFWAGGPHVAQHLYAASVKVY